MSFDTSLQKIANVIPTAAVKQSARSLDLLLFFKYKHLKQETQNFKTSQQYLCEDHWEENSREIWNNAKFQSDMKDDWRFGIFSPM